MAWRARGRNVDPLFVERDSLPPLPAPTAWPEPSWRQRYRALATQQTDCNALRTALADSAWPVRLRAADLTPAACSRDAQLVEVLRTWIDALPSTTTRRRAGGVSWHAGAHAAVAFARVRPQAARPRVTKLASHVRWEVRAYAARAAAVLADTARLRMLARDSNDNVKEIAIDALSKLTGHADDAVFLEALKATARRRCAQPPSHSKARRVPTSRQPRWPRSNAGSPAATPRSAMCASRSSRQLAARERGSAAVRHQRAASPCGRAGPWRGCEAARHHGRLDRRWVVRGPPAR